MPDNRQVALPTLKALDRQLGRDSAKAAIYDAQIKDMMDQDESLEICQEKMDQPSWGFETRE